MPELNLSVNELLTTTRAVRKRLDLTRPVEPEVICECLQLALQAPSGGNRQNWHFLMVTDAAKREALADLYRCGYAEYRRVTETASKLFADDPVRTQRQQRIMDSSGYLAEHMHEVPVLLIPCFHGRPDNLPASLQAGFWGSIIPAVWSFMLAARSRGLGTAWTTLHLGFEEEAATILNIPYARVTQAALIPVAYTLGVDFKPATRKPLDTVLHWNEW